MRIFFRLLLLGGWLGAASLPAQNIPLPEHPRPDLARPLWQNLNGTWAFAFDSLDQGLAQGWQQGSQGSTAFTEKIVVPFPWGAPLSGVGDHADIGWYSREIAVDPAWQGRRTFLTIGASDWETTVWLDGYLLGTHQGGYVPFSFDLTPHLRYGSPQQLVIRADDRRRDFTLYGKQGYGNARGIWQTVYLEARGQAFCDAVHFTPDIDALAVHVKVYLDAPAGADQPFAIHIPALASDSVAQGVVAAGKSVGQLSIPLPAPRRWTLDDPYLYDARVRVGDDVVNTYFGMRHIGVANLPGTDHPYITLNHEPVYLQLALDQSYHPEGYYTFPSDAFMREEIARSKAIGLNGIRTHIKADIPRKLYWADRLGLLVMADLPNSWGEPDAAMQAESEYTLRQMIRRDYNHPAIFSWIVFNETWGLRTAVVRNNKPQQAYLPETQHWVASMYYLAKSLDPTRLVEDNSICCGAGHTETDINSFHDYLPGWAWEEHLRQIADQSYPGSTFQFEAGFQQEHQPKINSECGNVWGYEGSTGDVDWSWDYHLMMNAFRRYPEIAGWLYTEHHDVINEWNGYWRYDRSEKFTGIEEIVPGMRLRDWHSAIYVSTGEVCRTVRGDTTLRVPLHISAMTGAALGEQLYLHYALVGIDARGDSLNLEAGMVPFAYRPWMQASLEDLEVPIPPLDGLLTLRLQVKDARGQVLHCNFMHFEVATPGATQGVIAQAPQQFIAAAWSQKQWAVLDGLKVNGTGEGYFEYSFPVGAADLRQAKGAYVLFEVSAKTLFDKDRDAQTDLGVDYMLGGRVSPSSNPNAYPMTDETPFPSTIRVSVGGKQVRTTTLADDPADHRGVLSWHHQLRDRKLREAGSYGYLLRIPISQAQLKAAARTGSLVVRLATVGEGGIAIYGRHFGRYPFDPSLVLVQKK
ncbi:MAG: hypothetical protein OHK0039_10870 [Bacteroidia bacterium]